MALEAKVTVTAAAVVAKLTIGPATHLHQEATTVSVVGVADTIASVADKIQKQSMPIVMDHEEDIVRCTERKRERAREGGVCRVC